MDVLFASNNITDWSGPVSTNTADGKHDAARVPYSLELGDYNQASMRNPHPDTSSGEVWYHFRVCGLNAPNSGDDGKLAEVKDGNGNTVVILRNINARTEARAVGDSTVETVSAPSDFPGSPTPVDLRISVTTTEIAVDFYWANALVGSITAPNSTGQKGNPRQFVFAPEDKDSAGGKIFFSEFIASETDTRGARLAQINPAAAGEYSDWTGSISDLYDGDPFTDIRSDAAGDRSSFNLGVYTGGDSIAAVVTTTLASAGPAGPQNLRNFLRAGGTDYDAPAVPLSQTIQSVSSAWKTDPSDGLSWAGYKINTIETGVMSEA